MNTSAIFFWIAKSFGWHNNNFLRSSLNVPCLIATEQYAYCSGVKINFCSHLSEKKPENPQKNWRNPFRSRIESITGAVKRSQKGTLETCLLQWWYWYQRLDWQKISVSANPIGESILSVFCQNMKHPFLGTVTNTNFFFWVPTWTWCCGFRAMQCRFLSIAKRLSRACRRKRKRVTKWASRESETENQAAKES